MLLFRSIFKFKLDKIKFGDEDLSTVDRILLKAI